MREALRAAPLLKFLGGEGMDFPGEKLVLRLWETIAEKGIGSLLKPWQSGREAKARDTIRRNEMLMLAQTELDAADIRSGKKRLLTDGTLVLAHAVDFSSQVDERIDPVIGFSDAAMLGAASAASANARSEINASKAIIYAEEQLANDIADPPNNNVDEDWLFAWRENAGRVSTEDLQRLWGSILAGEIKEPGKYSVRTLDFLKTLSRSEAEKISRMASFVIDGSIPNDHEDYLISKGWSFSALMEMQEIGLLSGVNSIGVMNAYSSQVADKFLRVLRLNNKALRVEHPDSSKKIEYGCNLVTKLGSEILGLGVFEADEGFLRLFGGNLVKKGFEVSIGDWKEVSPTQGRILNQQKIEI